MLLVCMFVFVAVSPFGSLSEMSYSCVYIYPSLFRGSILFFSRSCGSCCFSCAPSFMTAVVSSVVLIFLVGFRLALSSCAWRRSRSGVTSRPVSLCWAGRWLLPDCPCFRLLGAPLPPPFACVRDVCPSVPVFARVARRCAARVLH